MNIENQVVLGLGGNMGNRTQHLAMAMVHIIQQIGPITRVSSVYETAAWGIEDQPAFLNLALCISTPFSPLQTLERCLRIEKQMGRHRKMKWHFGPMVGLPQIRQDQGICPRQGQGRAHHLGQPRGDHLALGLGQQRLSLQPGLPFAAQSALGQRPIAFGLPLQGIVQHDADQQLQGEVGEDRSFGQTTACPSEHQEQPEAPQRRCDGRLRCLKVSRGPK